MKGLQLLRDAVIDALEKGGMTAIPAYPGKAKDYPGTVVTVDVGQAEGKPLAMGSYLGSAGKGSPGTPGRGASSGRGAWTAAPISSRSGRRRAPLCWISN